MRITNSIDVSDDTPGGIKSAAVKNDLSRLNNVSSRFPRAGLSSHRACPAPARLFTRCARGAAVNKCRCALRIPRIAAHLSILITLKLYFRVANQVPINRQNNYCESRGSPKRISSQCHPRPSTLLNLMDGVHGDSFGPPPPK